MRLKLFIYKSVHENAAYYYELAKEARKKRKGLEQAMEETKKELEKARKESAKKKVKVKRKREWYEAFHWYLTSGGRLAIGGRSAKQNDILFRKHMEAGDIFLHADIQGGSAFILKDGMNASEDELAEVAQLAACFSNAWKNANASVDVYAVEKEQVSKYAPGGYVPAGAFVIRGKRKWFRRTKLELRIGMGEKTLEIIAGSSKRKLKDEAVLLPSKKGKEKGKAAKMLAKFYEADADEFLSLVPNGKSKVLLGKKEK